MWADKINGQPMFDVLAKARQREDEGHYVARMEIGDTPGFNNDSIHNLVSKYALGPFRYSPSQGEFILREKVIESEWPSAHPDEIVIGPANFLITAALASQTSPGDLIWLPDPGFPSYKLAADFLSLKTSYYPTISAANIGFPKLSEQVKLFSERPKAIVINNPSNPLGIGFDGPEICNELTLLHSLGIKIIIDETYVNLNYDDTLVEIPSIPSIRIRSFSKEHCAPGLRIGYACGDKKSVKCMADLMSLTISCVPQFIQFAISDYLGSDMSKDFTQRLKETMAKRLLLVSQNLPPAAIDRNPNSAFYALLNVGKRGGDAAFDFLLQQNVATCPGSKFGETSKHYVRISVASSDEVFEKDMAMLSNALIAWFRED